MKIKRYQQFLESNSDNMWDIIPESVKELQLLFKSKGKKRSIKVVTEIYSEFPVSSFA